MPVPDGMNVSKKKAARIIDADEVRAREAQAAYDAKVAKQVRPVRKSEAPTYNVATAEATRVIAEHKARQEAKRLAGRNDADMAGSFDLFAPDAAAPEAPRALKPVRRAPREAAPVPVSKVTAEATPISQRRMNPRLRPENAAARQATEARMAPVAEPSEALFDPTVRPEPRGIPAEHETTLAPRSEVAPAASPNVSPDTAADLAAADAESRRIFAQREARIQEVEAQRAEQRRASERPGLLTRVMEFNPGKWLKGLFAVGALGASAGAGVEMSKALDAARAHETSSISTREETRTLPAASVEAESVSVDESNVEVSKPTEATPAPEAAPVAKAAVERTTTHRVRTTHEPSALEVFAANQAYKKDLLNLHVSDDNFAMPTPRIKHTESHAKKTTGPKTAVGPQTKTLKERVETFAAGKQKTKDMSRLADSAEMSQRAEKSKASLETWMAGQRMISKAKSFDGVHPETFKLEKKDATRLAEGDPKNILEALAIWKDVPSSAAFKNKQASERLSLLKQEIQNVKMVDAAVFGQSRPLVDYQIKQTQKELARLAEQEKKFIEESEEEEIFLDDVEE